jgi:acetolactate synthase-1/2/3 large subunit
VTTDVGSHKYLFGQFWPSRHPETFWMSNGLSGMAYGLSAAIGAKLAQENRKLEPYRMDFGPIDTVKMAEACGVEAIRTTSVDELGAAVKRAVAQYKSLMVAIPVHYAAYRKLF